MPGLRLQSEQPDASVVHDLRSSRTLLGKGASCDVVVNGNDVQDVHAVIQLDAGKHARLVPLSGTNGPCYLNGNLVHPDGMVIAHGDQITLGDTSEPLYFDDYKNEQPSSTTSPHYSVDSTRQSTSLKSVEFRRALNALRGDKSTKARRSVLANSSFNARRRQEGSSASSSKDQLNRFLAEASSDSVLSNFVDKKLGRSQGKESRRKLSVLEPPPSLSSSAVSSVRSSIESQKNREQLNEPKSSRMLSTKERNQAELEKLRLSQQVREINKVLNGSLDFKSSYLSEDKINPSIQSSIKDQSSMGSRHAIGNEFVHSSSISQAKFLQRRKSLVDSTSSHNLHKTLLQSTESQDDLAHKGDKKDCGPTLVDKAVGSSKPMELPLPSVDPKDKSHQRTRLHQMAIDKFIRNKQREIVSDAYVQWVRSVRIYKERQHHLQIQLKNVYTRLQRYNRKDTFHAWRNLMVHHDTLLENRLTTMRAHVDRRRLSNMWHGWMHHISDIKRKHSILRLLILQRRKNVLRGGMKKWLSLVAPSSDPHVNDDERDELMCRIIDQSLRKRVVQRYLSQWKECVQAHRRRSKQLKGVLALLAVKRKLKWWHVWRQNAYNVKISLEVQQGAKEYMTLKGEWQRQKQRVEEGERKIQALHQKLSMAEHQCDELKRSHNQAEPQEKIDKKNCKRIKQFLEETVSQTDNHIFTLSSKLEELVELSDVDVKRAQLQAASFLVETMVDQKVKIAETEVQELHSIRDSLINRAALAEAPVPTDLDINEFLENSKSGYMFAIVKQRLKRYTQLLQGIAELAAMDADGEADGGKLRHAMYLVQTVGRRASAHLTTMVQLHYNSRMDKSDPPSLARKA